MDKANERTEEHLATSATTRQAAGRLRRRALFALGLGLAAAGGSPCFAAGLGSHAAAPGLPTPDPLWSLPFVAFLLAIAVLPVVPTAHRLWEQNAVKLLAGLGLGTVVLVYYGCRGYGRFGAGAGWPTVAAVLEHALLRDYLPLMVLLASLFVIAGGLKFEGGFRPTPTANTGLLAFGALAASLIGTTGASLVLIRPLLHSNRNRVRVRHTVVFFIFLVSNVGGCLLPTGDPPLFLGYLLGVPFLWTLRLFGPWLVTVAALLFVYYVWDLLACRREAAEDPATDGSPAPPRRLIGSINLVWLLGVILSVALVVPGERLAGTARTVPPLARETLLAAFASLSLATTPKGLRRETGFTFEPVAEVACLFLGLFLTMQVPLELLQSQGEALGLRTPLHYFWTIGLLSSVLDNAPTYLAFVETARSLPVPPGAVAVSLPGGAVRDDLLRAVSLGSVFLGAATYLGNAPNLMVKAMAEREGVAMPGFFGYLGYSLAVLFPLFGLVSLLFLAA